MFRKLQIAVVILILGLSGLCLTACLRTPITHPGVDDTVHALARANEDALYLQVEDETHSNVLGHQYLFIAIPFGSVESDDIRAHVFDAAFTALSLKGKKPIIQSSVETKLPALTLTIKEMQATAYDFIAVRWIKTRLIIDAQFTKEDGQTLQKSFSAEDSAFKRFAFSKQLSFYFNRSTRDLFKDIADFTTPEGVVFEARY